MLWFMIKITEYIHQDNTLTISEVQEITFVIQQDWERMNQLFLELYRVSPTYNKQGFEISCDGYPELIGIMGKIFPEKSKLISDKQYLEENKKVMVNLIINPDYFY